MPYDVPAERVDQVCEAKDMVRTVLSELSADMNQEGDMADKVQIDVLTLDSVQCAACGYMMNR